MIRNALRPEFLDVTRQHQRDGSLHGKLLKLLFQSRHLRFSEPMQRGDSASLEEVGHRE